MAAILTLVVAFVSPLDFLADRVSFLAHMAQHLLLLLVIPTFLVLGAPSIVAQAGRVVARHPAGRYAVNPFTALVVSIGALWTWHVPRLYDAAVQNNLIHVMQHGSFLATAFLFWWPVLRPQDLPRQIPEIAFVLYLFAAAVASSLLAAFIALSPVPLYQIPGSGGLPGTTLPRFGLSPLDDQQLGGLLMWGVGSLWYFAVAAVIFVCWISHEPTTDTVLTVPRSHRSGATR
jgi:cytochrome c oxidase assembly factor CtaG